MPIRTHLLIDSPIGTLTLVNSDGVLSGLYMVEHRHGPGVQELGSRVRHGFEHCESELREYFDRQRTHFTIPIALDGTDFQKRVWQRLSVIPYGETISYARLAEDVGNVRAVRAVGLANGRNPISIVVPCHRVIGSNGSLVGYGGGLARKQMLLDLEGAPASRQLSLLSASVGERR